MQKRCNLETATLFVSYYSFLFLKLLIQKILGFLHSAIAGFFQQQLAVDEVLLNALPGIIENT